MITSEQIASMKDAMETIGRVCGSVSDWGDCSQCPFDEFCTAINDALYEDFHTMEEAFCGVEREG